MKSNWVQAAFWIATLMPLAGYANCPPGFRDEIQAEEAQKFDAPPGFDHPTAQFSLGGSPLDSPIVADDVRAGPKAQAELKKGKTIDLTWTSQGNSCLVKVSPASNAPGTSAAADPVTVGDEMTACAHAATNYASLISQKSPEFALVVFCESGTTMQLSSRTNDVVSVGDPIYVGLYADPGKQTHIKFEWPSCAPRDAAPKRFGTDDFSVAKAQLTGDEGPHMIPAEPVLRRRCYNTDPQVKVTTVSVDGVVQALNSTETITQYERYNYSFQLGAVFTHDVDHDYAVTADSGGVSRIRDGGPTGSGPNYFAALTMYGLPYKICTAFKGCDDHSPYVGRDLVNDSGVLDRISGILGVGLEHPGDEFVAGLGFEVMQGVNLIGVYRMAKLDVLDGVKVGDEFTGDAADIPKQKKWEDGFYLGIAVDLGYVGTWFGRGK